jgi:CHAT domain-containing protein
METYTDFHLCISQDGVISAVSVEGERGSGAAVVLPAQIAQLMRRVEDNATDEELLKEFGRQLYALLLPGPIETHFNQTEAVARRMGHKVRIRLTVDSDELARLPWEFIYRQEAGYFFSIHPMTAFSRYLRLPMPPGPVRRREGPLHLLLIISSPHDHIPLDADEWEQIVVNSLAKPLEEGSLVIKVVKQATRREIGSALLDQSPDIVQFVGHGVYRDGKGHLALVDGNSGNCWFVDDARFADIFLSAGERLGLICLATCQSATSDSPRSYLGIAPQIVQRGVPAVVAMQYDVRFSIAKVFLEEFYKAVAARKPVDWAVQWARNQISLEAGLGRRDFATPVLFTRASDGNVFGPATDTADHESNTDLQGAGGKAGQPATGTQTRAEFGATQQPPAQQNAVGRELLIELREILASRFSDGELRDLCFDLGVDYESLAGEGKSAKAREFIAYLQRRGRLAELVSAGKQMRSDIHW